MATLSTDALAQQNAQDSGWLSRNSGWLVPLAVAGGGGVAWHNLSKNTRLNRAGRKVAELERDVEPVLTTKRLTRRLSYLRDAAAAERDATAAMLPSLRQSYDEAAQLAAAPRAPSVGPTLRIDNPGALLGEWEAMAKAGTAPSRGKARFLKGARVYASPEMIERIDKANSDYFDRLVTRRDLAKSRLDKGLAVYEEAAGDANMFGLAAIGAEKRLAAMMADPRTVEQLREFYKVKREIFKLTRPQLPLTLSSFYSAFGRDPGGRSSPASGQPEVPVSRAGNPYADRLSTPYKFMTDLAGPLLVPGYGGREGSWMKAHPKSRGLAKSVVLGGLGMLGLAKMKQSSDQEATVKAAKFFEMAGQTAAFDAMTNSVAVASSLQPGHFQTAFDAGDADGVAQATEALRNGLVSGFALGGDYETAASNAAMRVLSDDRFAYYHGRNVLSSMSAADRSALGFPDGVSVDSLPGDAVRDFGRRFFVDDALSRAAGLREKTARDADAAARYRKSEPKSGGAK